MPGMTHQAALPSSRAADNRTHPATIEDTNTPVLVSLSCFCLISSLKPQFTEVNSIHLKTPKVFYVPTNSHLQIQPSKSTTSTKIENALQNITHIFKVCIPNKKKHQKWKFPLSTAPLM
ncbi:hypothetical protein O6H91_01G000400 [Diphasiastrum complanatum]|uniref:Uncharacterized protein n=1 Tax=Diphasiastrum complanatum TaxID=34168 RepID=A0ACC2EMG0_DIPCM|nr:hypothetical protein O6H91_01G000400 [Diphasiastrum complanatum]